MILNEQNHLAFSDESGYNGSHRFRSIAVISGIKENVKQLNENLQTILHKYRKEEIKFKIIKGDSTKQSIAKLFFRIGLQYCKQRKIRINVLTWDTHDSRHCISGRKDIDNLKIMYYRVLKETKKDWKNAPNWEFYPDQFSAINWRSDITDFIEMTNIIKYKKYDHLLFELESIQLFPKIIKHKELLSEKYPIIQLADLFAGLIRFSHQEGMLYKKWNSDMKHSNGLLKLESCVNYSRSDIARFELMNYIRDESKRSSLGINFNKYNRFHTFHSRNYINFWSYIPQGEYDKAPN